MQPLIWCGFGLVSYLLGAVPIGYLVVKAKTGQDIRTLGSGNIGATNVARTQGRFWFLPVFIGDFFKGFVPVFWLAPWVAARWPGESLPQLPTLLAVFFGFAAMLGHLWPVTIGFRGGKGVATVGGILFALNWIAALMGLGLWILVFLLFRYVSLSSLVAALALPPTHHFTESKLSPRWQSPWIVTVFLSLAGILVIWRHRENIGRLLRGEEKRMGGRKV